MMQGPEPLLAVRRLTKCFPARRTLTKPSGTAVCAVKGVDLQVHPGETLGLLGESGCGKSTLARCIAQLLRADQGSVHFNGRDLRALSGAALRRCRRELQIIFQDPYGALNPYASVGANVAEGLAIHRLGGDPASSSNVDALLTRVGLPEDLQHRYPHELSGGQCQRAGIARALALSPKLLIADEPLSALDVVAQAQILDLLVGLQAEHELAILFISHDLRAVTRIAHRIAVMRHGRIIETGTAQTLLSHPGHPYTRELLTNVPRVHAPAPPCKPGGNAT